MQLAESEGQLSRWEEYYDRLQPRQVKSLIAYRRLHPWPEDREDWRSAVQTHFLLKAWTGQAPEPDKILEVLKPRKKKSERRGWISPNAAAAMVNRIAGGG